MEQKFDKSFWNKSLRPYLVKSDSTAWIQILNTVIPYAILWYLYAQFVGQYEWIVFPFIIVMAFFILRFFVLMHDCGHNALYHTGKFNKIVGLLLGVLTGMPQYVWSKHHAYHHKTNGDWEKYQGPLSVITTDEYAKLSDRQKKMYSVFRHPALFVPLGGFIYVLFNPRFNWMVGLIKLSFDVLKTVLLGSPKKAWALIKECPSKKWKSPKEFRHMTYNNLILLSLWYVMCQSIGVAEFFTLYVASLSLAGGLGILFFTVQHNFENSYACNTANTNYYKAALEGTSYLKLPAWLNWFTADIAYHHVHHLSSVIPNYQLRRCHNDFRPYFKDVKRVGMSEILPSIKYLLWDQKKEALISIEEFESRQSVSSDNMAVEPS